LSSENVKPVNNFHKTKNFLKGSIAAVILLILLISALYLVQAGFTPLESLSVYLTESNRAKYNLSVQNAQEFTTFKFRIPKDWDHPAILFSKARTKGVRIFLNGRIIFDNAEETRQTLFNGEENLVDLRNPQIDFPVALKIQVAQGGVLQLQNEPLIGDYAYLTFFAKLNTFLGDYTMLIMSGITLILALIMFSLAIKNRELFFSFFPFALGMSYYSFFFLINILYCNPTHLFRNDFLNIGGMHLSLKPLSLFGFLSIMALFSMMALFAGFEKHLFNSWKMTRLLSIISAGLLCFVSFNPMLIYYAISMATYGFFVILTYRSNVTFFNFLVVFQSFSAMHSLVSNIIYPRWNFHIYTFGSLIALSGYGFFFIMDFNKQHKELERKQEELQSSNEEMMAMNEELESSYKEIEKLNYDLEETVMERTEQLRKTMNSIKTLLNNAREGFLKFNASLIIEPEFSTECYNLFDGGIECKYFPALISGDDMNEMELVANNLRKILTETEEVNRRVLISLLPKMVEKNDKILSLEYRSITEEFTGQEEQERKIMVIARNITENLKLKNKLKEEKDLFEEIIKVIANYKDFNELTEDYLNFWENEVYTIVHSQKLDNNDRRNELTRRIHTFKGNFAGFGFKHLVSELHSLETDLSEPDSSPSEVMLNILDNSKYTEWLEIEMGRIYEYINPETLKKQRKQQTNRQKIKTAREWLDKTEKSTEVEKAKAILMELEQVRFKEVFEARKALVESTARRLGINLNEIQVKGENTEIDEVRLKPLFKSWTHIFRNILDHGIESPDVRVKKGKDELGTITVSAEKSTDSLLFTITDDGRGLDPDEIAKKAVKRGLISKKESNTLKKQEVLNLIFRDGFSTKKKTTEISGRGIGLASVKREVEKLDGKINVDSIPGYSTTFTMKIPNLS